MRGREDVALPTNGVWYSDLSSYWKVRENRHVFVLKRRRGSVSYEGSVPITLPYPPAPTGTRMAAGNIEVTEKRAVEEDGEESNVKVDIGHAGVGTTKSTPVDAANADKIFPQGEGEAIVEVEESNPGGLHNVGLAT